jgi:hypothetical protein
MKNNGKILSGALFLLLLAGIVVPSSAQIYTLNNGNSVVTIDTSAGLTGYLVDGSSQAKSQWFYYRIGDSGAESPISSLGSAVGMQSDARSLNLSYWNGQYSAKVVYTLTGGSGGTGQSSLNQSISFTNGTASPINLRFFDYSDYDLTGVSGGQSLQFGTSAIGPSLTTNSFSQSVGTATVSSLLISGARTVGHVEAALYNQTLASLTDAAPTTLNNVMGPVSGDVTATFEWDVTIPAGGNLGISKLISMQAVPEPSALGLLAMGLVAILRRRNRI